MAKEPITTVCSIIYPGPAPDEQNSFEVSLLCRYILIFSATGEQADGSADIADVDGLATYMLKQKLAGRKRYPLLLMLEPLFRCNLSCAGCGKIQYPSQILKKHLTPEECFKAAEECGAPMVSIPGGEPLLHPQMAEIVQGLVTRKKYVYLCTNGLLLKEKLPQFRPSRYLTINVHLDGQREEHDRSVCRKGGYDCAVEGIRGSDSQGISRHDQYHAVQRRRPESVRAFFDEMMDLGVEGMTLSPGYDSKAPDQDHLPGPDGNADALPPYIEQPEDVGVSPERALSRVPTGLRDYACTPWGMPAYNVFGWQKPCYLLQDGYAGTFAELLQQTEWHKYGAESGNPRLRQLHGAQRV